MTRRELSKLIGYFERRTDKGSWDGRFAGYQVSRALDHLDIANTDLLASLAYHRDAAEAHDGLMRGTVGVCRLSPAESATLDIYADSIADLTFRMEVYLYQARIVLDRIARLLHFAFRPARFEIGSHSSVAKLLPAIAAEHGVTVPAGFLASVDRLTQDVKGIRDRFVVHPSGPRGHLIRRVPEVGQDGVVRLKIKWASVVPDGDEAEPVVITSVDFTDLDTAIRGYVRDAVALIDGHLERLPSGGTDA